MSEYIKRELALSSIAFESDVTLERARQALKDVPSTDVVEVVRCKDCIHNGSVDTDCPFGWKDKKFNMPDPNDYCSYGEEQEHGNNIKNT